MILVVLWKELKVFQTFLTSTWLSREILLAIARSARCLAPEGESSLRGGMRSPAEICLPTLPIEIAKVVTPEAGLDGQRASGVRL
jgi:hypothetical protein